MSIENYRFELEIKTRGGETRSFPLGDGVFVLGRTPECQLYVADSSISREHTRITVSGDTITIEDLQSLNGTLVSGRKISEPTRVEVGDVVTFGELDAGLIYLDTAARVFVPEVWLELLNTSMKGKIFKVSVPRAVIGRSHSADLQVNHPTLSRAHAVLRFAKAEGGWLLEDRNSANGSFVDGVMISQALLSGGEKLRVGDVELAFLGNRKPVPRKRYGLLFVLVALLGVAISLLILELAGLIVE